MNIIICRICSNCKVEIKENGACFYTPEDNKKLCLSCVNSKSNKKLPKYD